jgi:uncharacterized membrane protein YbaN (DUF454 family)
MADPLPLTRSATGLRRLLYIGAGFFFVGLAILGAMLPLLPTTPFLLLASYFFLRSSPRLHNWLLRSRMFGQLLRDWEKHRGVRPRVKVVAVTLIPVVVFCSAFFGQLPWYLIALLVLLGLIGLTVVIRLPVVREEPPVEPVPSSG